MKDRKNLYLKMNYNEKDIYIKVREILIKEKGESEVFIFFEDINKMVSLNNIRTNVENKTMVKRLEDILGKNSVIIEKEG